MVDVVQPYYAAYCLAHGLSPERMHQRDQERWPGGPACGFHFWMRERWKEWGALRGLRRSASSVSGFVDRYGRDQVSIDHNDFGAWLSSWRPPKKKKSPPAQKEGMPHYNYEIQLTIPEDKLQALMGLMDRMRAASEAYNQNPDQGYLTEQAVRGVLHHVTLCSSSAVGGAIQLLIRVDEEGPEPWDTGEFLALVLEVTGVPSYTFEYVERSEGRYSGGAILVTPQGTTTVHTKLLTELLSKAANAKQPTLEINLGALHLRVMTRRNTCF